MISPIEIEKLKRLSCTQEVVELDANLLKQLIRDREILIHALCLSSLTATEIQEIVYRLETRHEANHSAP